MKKFYRSLATFLFLGLLSLTACATLPASNGNSANAPATASSSQAPGTAEEQQLAQRLFKQINSDRATNGLPALAWEPKLEVSAHQHDLVMAGGCGLMHQCPGEADPGTRISKQGVQWQTVGENIGEGGPVMTTNDAWNMTLRLHQGMMAEKPPDDGHRRNLLSQNFHRIGISISIDKNNTLWLTEDFAN